MRLIKTIKKNYLITVQAPAINVKSLCKDKSGVPPLHFNETAVHNTKDKAEILNNQFHATFTREDI